MNSSPLFIMVAESIEILSPISQLGWASACSGVTSAMSASDQLRKGPPDAVRTSRSTASRWRGSKTWKMALCSESTGSSTPPDSWTASINSCPAQTSASLLARATMAPRRAAASVGASPANPTTAAITHSAGRAAASLTASGPAAAVVEDPESAAFRSR